MPVALSDLTAMRDALVRARAQGMRKYEIEGLSVEYRSDSEMAAALADLDRRIATAGASRPRTLAFNTSKGL